MKGVELYAQVRYAVQIEGVSRRRSGAAFWHRSADGCEDAGVFGTARVPAKPAAGGSDPGSPTTDRTTLRGEVPAPNFARPGLLCLARRLGPPTASSKKWHTQKCPGETKGEIRQMGADLNGLCRP
jgi:hypothetical protein